MNNNKTNRHNNSVFCNACGRHKMLFETQQQADNFLKFNSEAIMEENGKMPIRSYRCVFCDGYHVTSIESAVVGERIESRDKKILQKIGKTKAHEADVKPFLEKLEKDFDKILSLFLEGDLMAVEDKLDVCSFDLDDLKEVNEKYQLDNNKYLMLLGKYNVLERTLEALKASEDMDDEEAKAYVSQHYPNIKTDIFNKNRLVRSIAEKIEVIAESIEALDENNELNDVDCLRTKYEQLLSPIKNSMSKRVRARYNTLIDQLCMKKRRAIKNRLCMEAEAEQEELLNSEEETGEPLLDSYVHTEYKRTMLELIEKVNIIKEDYEAEDYEKCIDEIDIAESVLDLLDVQNDDTLLISKILNDIKKQINCD